jgi:hypothetical protein
MRKVIYVSFVRLTDKISRDWYIDYLIAKGITVEYWDVISLVREEHDEINSRNPEYLHKLKEFNEFEAMLCLPQNRDTFYIMLITYEGRFSRIFRLLSKYNCRMLFIDGGAMPITPMPLLPKILTRLSNPLSLARIIFDRAKAYTFRRLMLVKPFDIVFAPGRAHMARDQYAKKVIPVNWCDYDQYIKVRSKGDRLVKCRYAVFLDINLPYQSDIKICGLPAVNPADYYRSLNNFFGLLELKYGFNVVIAAHPKANYEVDIFEGREIYRLRTPELVRDAEFVVTHTSIALSYAVLNMKPVVFIYTNDIMSLYKDTMMRVLYGSANYLDASIFNIDKITQEEQIYIKKVNQQCYENYKYDFLTTPESEFSTTQDIFFREITK